MGDHGGTAIIGSIPIGIYIRCHRSTSIDFSHDMMNIAMNFSVLRNSCIREVINLQATCIDKVSYYSRIMRSCNKFFKSPDSPQRTLPQMLKIHYKYDIYSPLYKLYLHSCKSLLLNIESTQYMVDKNRKEHIHYF